MSCRDTFGPIEVWTEAWPGLDPMGLQSQTGLSTSTGVSDYYTLKDWGSLPKSVKSIPISGVELCKHKP